MATECKQEYWDQISLVEDLRAFHPEAFNALSASDQAILKQYYALDGDVGDVYQYKQRVDATSPDVGVRAAHARQTLLKQLRVANT